MVVAAIRLDDVEIVLAVSYTHLDVYKRQHCDRIEFGVEKEVYQNAKYFVEEMDYNCFPDLDNTETTRQMSVAKVCDIMNWIITHLGFVNEDGFCVPVNSDRYMLGKNILLTDEDLAEINYKE